MDRETIELTKKYLRMRMENLDADNIEGKLRLLEDNLVMKILKDDPWFRETLQYLYQRRRAK